MWSRLAFLVVMSPSNFDDLQLVGFALEQWQGINCNWWLIGLEYAVISGTTGGRLMATLSSMVFAQA